MQPKGTRRGFLELGLGFASLAVFGYGLDDASGQFRFVSPVKADDGGSGSGSGSGSGGSGSGSGEGGNSGPGGGDSSGSGGGNSGPGGGDGGDNSGPGGGGGGDNSGPGGGGGGDNSGPGRDGGKPDAGDREGKSGHSRGEVVWSNVRADSVEVRYSDGWSEQVTSHRYRLRDPARRIVIERAPKRLDFQRLRSVAR